MSPVGTTVAQIAATDLDDLNQLHYTLTSDTVRLNFVSLLSLIASTTRWISVNFRYRDESRMCLVYLNTNIGSRGNSFYCTV